MFALVAEAGAALVLVTHEPALAAPGRPDGDHGRRPDRGGAA